MKKDDFVKIAAWIFLVVSLIHFIRGVTGFELIVAGWDVPQWVNLILAVVVAFVSYLGLTAR